MSTEKKAQIEALFRKQVEKDSNVKNAYLLVHSDKLNLHLNIAEGATGEVPVRGNPRITSLMVLSAAMVNLRRIAGYLCPQKSPEVPAAAAAAAAG